MRKEVQKLRRSVDPVGDVYPIVVNAPETRTREWPLAPES